MKSRSRSEAVVVGAGPAGLATAAMIERRGRRALTLERGPQLASSWRDRPVGMSLNTLRWMSDLPGMGMPRRHGRWPRREDWIAYLESYADAMRLPVRLDTFASRIERAPDGWEVETSEGSVRAKTVVVAIGHDHTPFVPAWPGAAAFPGHVLHSADFRDSKRFDGSAVLVVGSGTSGAEIATQLVTGGAEKVWLSMRSAPLILRREYLGVPSTVLGWISRMAPDPALDLVGWALHAAYYRDLAQHGLGRSPKRLSKMRRSYYSPLMDNGFANAVRRGEIEIVAPIDRFDDRVVRLVDGGALTPDAVIAATGYSTGLGNLVGHLGVVSPDGEPIVRRQRHPATAPGLYFAGYRFGLVALLPYISGDAKRIARSISRT